MNVLIYSADNIYKSWLDKAFHDIAEKSDITFTNANLIDKQIYIKQKNITDLNLIIFDEDSISFDFLMKIIINCKDSDRNVIYLRTFKQDKYMTEYTRKRLLEFIHVLYKDSIWILQDIVELCNVINKIGFKKHVKVEKNTSGYIDNDNILDYDNFLKETFVEYYQDGLCLLQQSKYIISVLNENKNN